MKLCCLLLLVAPSSALDFLVMADWGGSEHAPYTTREELSTAGGMGKVAEAVGASFSLAVGDNMYSHGLKDVDSTRFKDTFEDVFTADSLDFPFYVIAGNHDHIGSVQAQMDYSKKSSRWTYPDSWYTFSKDVGAEAGGSKNATIQFVMIDTVILSGSSDVLDPATGEVARELRGSELPGPVDRAAAQSQMDWLEHTLNTSKADFLVVAGHYPVWSICEHGPTSLLVDAVKPMLERHHVTAYIAGHDHCMETFVDGDIDYHGMGSAHENDRSTSHANKVPKDSLKFHTPGKSGGFGSFTVNASSFVARHHEGDGTLLYTHPTRGPRSKVPSPSPPAPPPAPAPAGRTWDCHDNHDVDTGKLHLHDKDLDTRAGKDISACEAACNDAAAKTGCTAISWHKTDSHCHVLSGKTPSSDDFVKALKSGSAHTACVLLESRPS